MPYVAALEGLYTNGVKFRHGQLIMVVGRPGSGKTAFALWLAAQWNLPTEYCSADMDATAISTRVAAMRTGVPTDEIETMMRGNDAESILSSVDSTHMTYSFDSPITEKGLTEELTAFLELNGDWPSVLVIDNLMDVEFCATDREEQMHFLQRLSEMTRWGKGITIIVLAHARELTNDVVNPPSRDELNNKLSQKPRLTLSVAINPMTSEFRVACLKQSGGKADPSAQDYRTLQAYPNTNRFGPYVVPGPAKW
jgi:archaellum biogenesis ATPase FlaH